jgi:hypothetical protein
MKVSDVVFQDFNGIRRFGVVRQVEVQADGWTYAGVKWIDDDAYSHAMARLSRLRGGDHARNSYRVDELKVVDAKKEIETLTRCSWLAEHEVKASEF